MQRTPSSRPETRTSDSASAPSAGALSSMSSYVALSTFAAPAMPLHGALTPSSGASTPVSSVADEDVVFKSEYDALSEDDAAAVFYAGGGLASLASSSSASPFLFSPMQGAAPLALSDVAPLDLNRHQPAVIGADTDADDELDDGEPLFGAYVGDQQAFTIGTGSGSGSGGAWDYYYPRPPTDAASSNNAAVTAPRYPTTPTETAGNATSSSSNASRGIVRRASVLSTTSSTAAVSSTTGNVAVGSKRAFDSMSTDGSVTSSSGAATPSPSPRGSPTATVASSMIAMRQVASSSASQPLMVHARGLKTPSSSLNSSTNTINISTGARASARVKKEADATAASAAGAQGATTPAGKKTKVSRERQLKINAASRRCRKKQKLELQFLRTHVVELQSAIKEQVTHLRASLATQQRAARLAQLLDESVRKVEEMSSGSRSSSGSTTGTPTTTGIGSGAFSLDKLQAEDPHAGMHSGGEESSSSDVNQIETDDASSVMHAIDPATGYSLSEERKQMLLNVAGFIRMNMSLESGSFSPEVISCLPIEMDGWQLRLAITEKNYTIHNAKFFPCAFTDMYDFCWETNVAQKISIKHGRKHYVVVTPLAPDVAHVYSKTTGKWSLNVHGVPNVSYNSLVCRRFEAESQRGIICQQSVLEERDFQDEDTIPWLFKRWVVFRPREVDGVQGTYVEAYRTASYATGRLIYKGHNTYDSFCEHLIRRYAESNSLLERMMARDPRFAQNFDPTLRGTGGEHATISDRMTKDLLLF